MSAEASALTAFSPWDAKFVDLVDTQPAVISSSIRVYGCVLDEVVNKFSITSETDVFDVLLGVVKTLTELGHGLYDPCAGPFLEEDNVEEISGSYCEALLRTLLDEYGVDPEDDMDMVTFLIYKLSPCEETPLASRNIPDGLRTKVEVWQAEAERYKDFNLEICEVIEDDLRYDADLIVTANSYFRLATKDEVEKRMLIALVGSADRLCLL